MAKDRGGHGSEKRGVSAVQARNDRMFAMFDRAKAQGHYGLYSGPATPSGGGQPVASNVHAAATLASGPKSAPVDTHSGTLAGEIARRKGPWKS